MVDGFGVVNDWFKPGHVVWFVVWNLNINKTTFILFKLYTKYYTMIVADYFF